MIFPPKCPSCQSPITKPDFKETVVGSGGRAPISTVCYVCPICSVVLGVEEDPIIRQRRLIEELTKVVRKEIQQQLSYQQQIQTRVR